MHHTGKKRHFQQLISLISKKVLLIEFNFQLKVKLKLMTVWSKLLKQVEIYKRS